MGEIGTTVAPVGSVLPARNHTYLEIAHAVSWCQAQRDCHELS